MLDIMNDYYHNMFLLTSRIGEEGIVDTTIDVLQDLLSINVETSIQLPKSMKGEQIASFAYTQLLAITESWEHNIRHTTC